MISTEILTGSLFHRHADQHTRPSSEEELREHILSAKDLVAVSLWLIRQGAVHEFEQSVTIATTEERKGFKLTDTEVYEHNGIVRSVGNKQTGLWVYPGTFTSSGVFTEGFNGVVLPRDPKLVTPDSIRHITAVQAASIRKATAQIEQGKIVSALYERRTPKRTWSS
jgi:hypothetical protein